MINIDLNQLTQMEQMDRFIGWLITKPADERFDFCHNSECCFAQYLKETGVTDHPMVSVRTWTVYSAVVPYGRIDWYVIPEPICDAFIYLLGDIDRRDRMTFGAVLERLLQPV